MKTATIITSSTPYRQADVREIRDQIGLMTMLAISGGKWYPVYRRGDTARRIGIAMPVGVGREVQVLLQPDDTYTVTRVRTILKGARKGEIVKEAQYHWIHAEQLAKVAYEVSLWR